MAAYFASQVQVTIYHEWRAGHLQAVAAMIMLQKAGQ
jgi:hypothetical protein